MNISLGTSAWSCGQPSTGMDSRNLSLALSGCQGFGRVIKSCIFFSGWETIVQFSTLKKISVCIYGELTTCSLRFADTIIEKNSPPRCLFLISLLHPTDLQTRSETASGLIQPQSSGSNLLVTLITFLTASFIFPEHEWCKSLLHGWWGPLALSSAVTLPYIWGNYLTSPAVADSQGQVLVIHTRPVTISSPSQLMGSQGTAVLLCWVLTSYNLACCAVESHLISLSRHRAPNCLLIHFSGPKISTLCPLFLQTRYIDPSIKKKKIKKIA